MLFTKKSKNFVHQGRDGLLMQRNPTKYSYSVQGKTYCHFAKRESSAAKYILLNEINSRFRMMIFNNIPKQKIIWALQFIQEGNWSFLCVSVTIHCNNQLQYTTQGRNVLCISAWFLKALDPGHSPQPPVTQAKAGPGTSSGTRKVFSGEGAGRREELTKTCPEPLKSFTPIILDESFPWSCTHTSSLTRRC